MPDAVTITLPHPPRCLSPNARPHYMVKARAAKNYRQLAAMEATAALRCDRPRWTKARTRIVWYTRTKTAPDPDNSLASCKSLFDGLTDAGLLADDRGLAHEPITFIKDSKHPRVEVTVLTLA